MQENNKILQRMIKEDKNRRGDIFWSWIRKLKIAKVLVLP